MKTIYVSGRYSSDDHSAKVANIRLAFEFAVRLWRMGWGVFCPHLNTAFMENRKIDYESFMKFDLLMVEKCDAIFMLPNWTESPGAQRERRHALTYGKVVFYNLQDAKRYIADYNLMMGD